MASTPDGRFFYVANIADETVSQYSIGPAGALTPLGPTPRLFGGAGDIAVTPDGKTVYVTSGGEVKQYDVASNGTLSPKTPPSVAAPFGVFGIVVSADGQSAYVATRSSGTIAQFDISPGGTLSPKSPATVPAGGWAFDLVIHPDGHSLYATVETPRGNFDPPVAGKVAQFSIGSGGTLGPKSPSTVAAGITPLLLDVSTDGKSLYVANQDDDTVSQYDVSSSGLLSAKSPATVPTGGAPTGVAFVDP
jgi:YVTN family beta-propeller protein